MAFTGPEDTKFLTSMLQAFVAAPDRIGLWCVGPNYKVSQNQYRIAPGALYTGAKPPAGTCLINDLDLQN